MKPSKILASLLFSASLKTLCMRSYRSTDFDVHRNWLAITRQLPLRVWYFDDVNGTTVHTLDYPPSFAFFEYFISTNRITKWLLQQGIVDERCMALLPDDDNQPSDACVAFHRATVVASDLVLWIGAYVGTKVMSQRPSSNQPVTGNWSLTFLLIVLNPGLFWLDHIHFQYNGMLLGILLLSVGFVLQASMENGGISCFVNHALGAISFAFLLTLKHLYLMLAPLYFVHLLGRYCVNGREASQKKVALGRFLAIGVPTACTVILPFLPFFGADNPKEQLQQMISRLFPFGRGLCHDYWAANVWSVYLFCDKLVGFVFRTLGHPEISFPVISPKTAAVALLVGIVPGLLHAWKSRNALPDTCLSFVRSLVFCAFSGFMLAYHVHEKAIMTVIIPLSLIANTSKENARLYLRVCALGHFGLMPLLFRPVELLFKVSSYVGFLLFSVYGLEDVAGGLIEKKDVFGMAVLVVVGMFTEAIHPLIFKPQGLWEFLPLMVTSVLCACGLIACWAHVGWMLLRM